jgi:hypothetical protein
MPANNHRTRGSAADREYHCAGAIGWEGPTIDITGPEARLGTAVDRALGAMVLGEPVDLDEIARAHGVDRDQLGVAYHGGCQVWEKIKHWFPNPQVQVRVEGDTTRGTADLVGYEVPRTIAVLDWKLAMSDTRHVRQLMAYALPIAQGHGMPESGYILGIEVHTTPAVYFVHRFSVGQLLAFRDRLTEQHKRAGEQFAPGSWCQYCPRAHDCAPRDQWLRGSATALTTVMRHDMIPRDVLAAAWDRSRALRRALDGYDKAVRLALEEGPIELEEGRLELVETETAQIKASTAIEAADLVKAAAPRGKAAEWQRVLMTSIDDAGGITTKTTRRVKKVTK